MSLRDDLNRDLAKYGAKRSAAQGDVTRLKYELEERVEGLKWLSDMERKIRVALHELDGREKNCAHGFIVEPSGRGIGWDHVCYKCKWVENFEPSY